MKKLYILLFSIFISVMSFGQVIYDADFSNDGDGFPSHTTSSPPAPAPASVNGGTSPNDWTLSYESTPASDGSANSFSVSGGALVSDDWGGQGIFQSTSIDVSSLSSINISATTVNSGANDDNFIYFYILDGGTRVETSIGATNNGDPLDYSIIGLDVSTANSLIVGFEFSENGGGDGYTTSSFQVINAAGCSISGVTANAICNGNNADVTINFSATNASGSYEVSIDSGIWQPITNGGTVTITGPTSSQTGLSVEVRDTNDTSCIGSSTVDIPTCPTATTCFDLSNGTETFELVAVTDNSDVDQWTLNSGTYAMNGFVGGGQEDVEQWLVFGPLDMTGVTDLSLLFDATESFGVTDLQIVYTNSYSGCPSGTTWTNAQTISDPGAISVDLSAATGSTVFIGIQYLDDGADGYSGWSLSNVELAAFGSCPTLGVRPTSDCGICGVVLGSENYVCATNNAGDNNDSVTVEIPYTGSDNTITSVSTTSGGTVAGDSPATVADGTITITGLSEGDAWDITINGGNCNGTTLSGTILSSQCDPVFLVINEILADPDGTNGDANGDGTSDTTEDEFVEIYNTGTSVIDLENFTIEDEVQIRHTFPPGTSLNPNSFITVFGGGSPNGIPGVSQVASSGSLGLNNSGDTVTIRNGSGTEIISYNYGSEAGNNQSIAREPDFTGAFVQHSTIIVNGGALFSPGLENDNATLSNSSFDTNVFSLYPNPTTNGRVTINSRSASTISVVAYDILGKQVKNEVLVNNTLNVSDLRTGVYILSITQDNATTTKKLVIR